MGLIIDLQNYYLSMQLKNRILFVCMGNICRSPTAEGAFRSIVKNNNELDNFEIDSAGTHAYHIGNSPDQRAQQTAIDNGVNLSNLRARQVHESDFYYYDYIIAMDLSLIHISEPTRLLSISYAVFCLKKKMCLLTRLYITELP